MNKNAFTSDAPTNREKACQLAYNFYHNTKVQEFETTVLAPAGYKETTFSLEGGKNVRLLGRAQATDKGVKTNFPADGMEFTLDCGGTLTLTISATDTANAYRTFIDGEAVSFAPTKNKEVVLTEMLQPGMHTIRIVQDKEINTSGKINTISAITVSAKGGEMKATEPAKYLIEFIGASTEAGCGTLGGNNDTWSSDYHSVTSGHTYKLGQILGADVNVVAKGGIGLVAKAGKHATDGLYFYHNGYASDEVYKPTRKPDVIAINTPCSNDKGDYSSKEELLEKGRAFVKKLIEVNGTDVHYVFFGGHMMGKNPSSTKQEIGEVKEQLAKEFGFPYITLPNGPNGVPAKAGGTPHPSAEDGTKQAEAFAEYLKTVLK